MDCSNARLLLHFSRRELAASEAAELDGHLSGCGECAALAKAEHALDHALGRAMKQVPIPAGLRDRILDHLADDRARPRKLWLARTVRIGAVAAALLLLILGVWAFYPTPRTPVDLSTLFNDMNIVSMSPERLEAEWLREGVRARAPEFVNYSFFVSPSVESLPGHDGKKVAVAFFCQRPEQVGRDKWVPPHTARIFAVPVGQVDLRGAQPPFQGDYPLNLKVREPDVPNGFVYLIFYTGDSCDWLEQGA